MFGLGLNRSYPHDISTLTGKRCRSNARLLVYLREGEVSEADLVGALPLNRLVNLGLVKRE